jgi:hypothetical protein
MMRRDVENARRPLAVSSMAYLAALLAEFFGGIIALADTPAVTLVEPQWQQQTDAQGTMWMIDQQANVQVNSGNSLFMQAGVLAVNGQQFSPQRVQMTPDGHEYVFEGVANGPNVMAMPNYGNVYSPYGGNYVPAAAVQSTRRIKLDLANSTVRFVETFQNTTATPQQINVAVSSPMRMTLRSAICGPSGASLDATTGQPLVGDVAGANVNMNLAYRRGVRSASVHMGMPDRDNSIAFSAPAGNFSAAFFYLPGSATVKPAIEIQGMRVVRASFNVTVPAQSTASIVWGLAQPKAAGAIGAQQMKDQLKFFQDRQWLAGLPDGVIKSIVNLRRASANGPMGPLLQPVLELAARFKVPRDKSDVVVQDDQVRLMGVISGSGIDVATSLGKVSLPLADVALLVGGGGIDRPMRVYLRNGEILLGRIEAKDLSLKAADGVVAKLPPEKINLLFFHAAANDGKTPGEASAILLTQDGQRLLVGGGDRFRAVSPWGALDVGIDEIASLASRSEPQPLYQVVLRDGSTLSVVPEGDAPEIKTLRFGPVQIAPVGLRQLWSLKMPAVKKAENDDAAESGAVPQLRLIGDTVLAGTLDTPKLILATAGGVLGLSSSGVQAARRAGDATANGPFQIEMSDGRRVTGTLANRTVAMQFHGKMWEIPSQHLVGIAGHPKEAVAERTTEKGSSSPKQSGGDGQPLKGLPAPPTGGDDPFGAPPAAQPTTPATAPADPVMPSGGLDPFSAAPTTPTYIPGSTRTGFFAPTADAPQVAVPQITAPSDDDPFGP